MFTQEFLHAEALRRIRDAQPASAATPLPDELDFSATHPMETAAWAKAQEAPTVTVVVRRFEPAAFARAAVEAVQGFSREARETWFHAYTRTVFLTGDPQNLRGRFTFDHTSDDGSMAWTAPGRRSEQNTLRRLLQLFPDSALPPLGIRLAVSAPVPAGSPPPEARLYLATSGVTRADYLVHLHHVLAEAVITGLLKDAGGLVLHHVPQLSPADGPFDMLRVTPASSPSAEGRLRAFAGLTCVTDW